MVNNNNFKNFSYIFSENIKKNEFRVVICI